MQFSNAITFREESPLFSAKHILQAIVQCSVAGCAVGVATFVAYRLHLYASTISLIYLLIVLFVTLLFGFWEAAAISLLSVGCLDYYFIPPLFSFAVEDSQELSALIAFMLCAVVVSRISSQKQKAAMESESQRISIEKLYELSRGTLLFDLRQPPGLQIVRLIHQVFSVEDVAVFDANVSRLDHVGSWSEQEKQIVRTAYILDKDFDDSETHTAQRIVRLGTTSVGAIAIRGGVDSLVANALASLAAITFERYRSFEKETRAETAHQSEQLRTAVLDALAHAFKTPLTVIRTASSGLLEIGGLSGSHRELAMLIDEESIRLNQLCTRLLETAKLEAEEISLQKDDVIVSQLVAQVLSELTDTLRGHPIELSIADQDTSVRGDRELLAIILTQYLDNAAKYSSPETPIGISVRESRSELLLSVKSQGALIQLQDREKIFERFYRSSEAKNKANGAGVGLSIVKKAAEAHRGHVWVISAENEGTTFFLSVPKTQMGGTKYGVWNDPGSR
jgi:two-component system sensor histidine kinase KdpD